MPFECTVTENTYPALNVVFEEHRIASIEQVVADLDMKIVWDEVAGVIKIGKATFYKYTNWKSAQAFGKFLMHEHDITNYSQHPKWLNKATCALVKGSLKQTYGFYKALQYKVFVVPHKHLINKISFARGRINVKALERIRENKDVLQQVYDDKLFHLLPVVAMMGKPPQALKKELGPTWKTLSKNSLNKNKAVVRATVGKLWNRTVRISGQHNGGTRLAVASSLPTTVLEEFSNWSNNGLIHVSQHYRGKWNAKFVRGVFSEWGAISSTLSDTERMAAQLDEKFDPLWTPRKMKEKHDDFARRINALRYSPEPIPWLENILPRFEHEGCVATLLNNRAAIANEGSEMGHCVGSYAESVASKSYLVYSVVSAQGERSTLGIRVTVVRNEGDILCHRFSLNQHYRRFNKSLEEDAEKEIGQLIVNTLNKETK